VTRVLARRRAARARGPRPIRCASRAPRASLLRSGLPGRGHGGCRARKEGEPRALSASLRSRQDAGGPRALGSALVRGRLALAPRVDESAEWRWTRENASRPWPRAVRPTVERHETCRRGTQRPTRLPRWHGHAKAPSRSTSTEYQPRITLDIQRVDIIIDHVYYAPGQVTRPGSGHCASARVPSARREPIGGRGVEPA
jgi:hypothetical protein